MEGTTTTPRSRCRPCRRCVRSGRRRECPTRGVPPRPSRCRLCHRSEQPATQTHTPARPPNCTSELHGVPKPILTRLRGCGDSAPRLEPVYRGPSSSGVTSTVDITPIGSTTASPLLPPLLRPASPRASNPADDGRVPWHSCPLPRHQPSHQPSPIGGPSLVPAALGGSPLGASGMIDFEHGAPGPPGSHLAPLGSDMPSFTAATMSLARARPESAALRGSRPRAELRGLLPSFAFDGD